MISITQNDGYLHFYYDETCADEPDVVRVNIATLFEAIATMPEGQWYVRVKPTIERHRQAWTDEWVVNVRCRFSAKLGTSMLDQPLTLLGLPKESA